MVIIHNNIQGFNTSIGQKRQIRVEILISLAGKIEVKVLNLEKCFALSLEITLDCNRLQLNHHKFISFDILVD